MACTECESNKISVQQVGWTPEFALEEVSGGHVQKVVNWIGGSGNKPATGLYVAESGFTTDITKAVIIPSGNSTGVWSNTEW